MFTQMKRTASEVKIPLNNTTYYLLVHKLHLIAQTQKFPNFPPNRSAEPIQNETPKTRCEVKKNKHEFKSALNFILLLFFVFTYKSGCKTRTVTENDILGNSWNFGRHGLDVEREKLTENSPLFRLSRNIDGAEVRQL